MQTEELVGALMNLDTQDRKQVLFQVQSAVNNIIAREVVDFLSQKGVTYRYLSEILRDVELLSNSKNVGEHGPDRIVRIGLKS